MQAVDGGFEGFGVIVADAVDKFSDFFNFECGAMEGLLFVKSGGFAGERRVNRLDLIYKGGMRGKSWGLGQAKQIILSEGLCLGFHAYGIMEE